MDIQNACLSKIVLDGDLLPFIEARITGDFFPDSEHGRVWAMVQQHYQQHGKPPDQAVVHKAYPTYKFKAYPQPTAYYLTQLREDRKKVILTKAVQEYALRLEQDEGMSIGSELETILRQGLANASHEISQGRDSDFFGSRDRIMDRLIDRRNNPGVLRPGAISTSFDGLDRITGGLQKQQLITLMGTPKQGKSSIALAIALAAKRNGQDVVIFTFEMANTELEDRLVSLLTKIDLNKILSGTFTPVEENAIDKALRMRAGLPGLTITSDIENCITMSGIQAKINQHLGGPQRGLVVIDGMYLMTDEGGFDQGTPQALTSLTRSAKRLAQVNEIPVLVTTQALLWKSKGGLTMASVGYSSSFAQDSDILLGVEEDPDLPGQGISVVKVIASRSGPKGDVHIHFDWNKGLIEEIDLNTYNQFKAQRPAAAAAMGAPRQSSLRAQQDEEDEVA